ncbi:putative Zn-dependent protease [Congregibacter litoralis KT71]|uniref:Putative Zn-dependent protease n=1 Tax=Congregibacter litoralis KT71 TaxID=314285 RepID=A4A6N7_9GAMM|nr:putative Zn-dependent protease [Congregibacter litoralis KT71]
MAWGINCCSFCPVNTKFQRLLIATVLGVTLASASGCAVNPATGGTSVVLSGASGERETGQEMYDKFLAEGAFYEDPELQAYVEKIGQRLVAQSDMPDREFTFAVIDAPEINAFATPGGFIYVNRGLIGYLNSEAELAGVIGHEIAHVTARHHGRRKTAGVTSKVLSTTAYVLTGSSAVYEASNMYGAEVISGYGRDMELEADGLGAEYMYKAGYEPEALLDVIGVLKNQEQFMRLKAKAAGKSGTTYHGLYATHPRNDKRLQTVIRAANELDDGTYIESPEEPGEFRRVTDGLVWGESVEGQRADDRYYHNKLGFTIEQPEGWAVTTSSRAVVVAAPDQSASLTITLRRKDPSATPQAVLESSAKGTLRDGETLQQSGLDGYTAVAAAAGKDKRLAVFNLDNLTYLFEGDATDFATSDSQLLALIESFRAMHPKEKSSNNGRYVRYIQVPRGADVRSLAASARIPDAEAQLRLINDFYPRGEPRTGDWIKVIQ